MSLPSADAGQARGKSIGKPGVGRWWQGDPMPAALNLPGASRQAGFDKEQAILGSCWGGSFGPGALRWVWEFGYKAKVGLLPRPSSPSQVSLVPVFMTFGQDDCFSPQTLPTYPPQAGKIINPENTPCPLLPVMAQSPSS